MKKNKKKASEEIIMGGVSGSSSLFLLRCLFTGFRGAGGGEVSGGGTHYM
jgi:hypothetical protein